MKLLAPVCGRAGERAEGKTFEDDSLTSLHWLTGVRVHDGDGMPLQLQYTPPSPAPSGSGSDDGEVGASDPPSGKCGDAGALKPPYSYATLIIMAMKDNASGKMTLSEIYRWISDKFVFYQTSPPTWHNSIRHNLSLNKCFKKIPRKKGEPGKGGYWALVPEFADKLLESNIRKRRASAGPCGDKVVAKRQRLHDFETELMLNLKSEPYDFTTTENSCNRDSCTPDIPFTPDAPATPESLNSPASSNSDQPDCPDVIQDTCGMELLSELEHCRRDHAYGKSPVVNYDDSDEENIRAIAMHLKGTSSIIDTSIVDTSLVDTCPDTGKTSTSSSKLSTTISSAILSDCIWRDDENLSPDTMELLEAQQYEELTSCTNFDEFCLSPPMSGDDEGYDDVDDGCYDERRRGGDDLLTVQGTAMTIFETSMYAVDRIGDDLLKEQLSPVC